ncbi:Lipid A core-O-antigen ligase-like enyme [Hyella patelloides LEGE 07179]|uniref:Lipid A core-O-antigen ligase-like enyme n=1 Tax=Hyella patelloides LEGE 07179 TaxID=945734 RepID=A0A563W0V0_9CYAN|nr:O-antigen ligase family protein [Hyella patelloides]VEP17311.1 Lipid A core-O-antigen ligase-like enyme [Hyella patelloides LEGE 07179]
MFINKQPHSKQKSYLWLIFQISILVLPLFPALGELGLFFILVSVWHSNFSRIIRNPLGWGWLILAVWLIINSFFAYQPSEAWLGLANFLPFFALFIAISNLVNTCGQLYKLAWLLIIPSVPIIVLGLYQLYFNGSSPQLLANILGWKLIPQGVPPGRMSSVFIYANFLAIYLSFTFILTVGLWLSNWYSKPKQNSSLIILTVVLIINSIGLILANSRNSWLIVFLACFTFAIYLSWYWLVSGITATIAIILGASFGDFWGQQWLRKIVPELIWGRLSDEMYPDRPVETLRITQWQFCWSKIQERPLMGWGLRNFTPLYLEETNFWFGHPHNLFIMLSLEIGIVGTIFLCLIVGYILVKAILSLIANQKTTLNQQDKLINFTYVITFISCVLFNIFDVTLFDLRVNTIGWIILAVIAGVIQKPLNFNNTKINDYINSRN